MPDAQSGLDRVHGSGKPRRKRCFISAPMGAGLDVLRESLASRDVQILAPQGLDLGGNVITAIQRQLSRADFVIGVLTSEQLRSAWVYFELGQASALGRRIMLIAPPGAGPIPSLLSTFLLLRIDLDNRQAIDFALDQLLAAPQRLERHSAHQPRPFHGLGSKVDALMATVHGAVASNNWFLVEEVVADALRLSGAEIVAVSPLMEESRPDLVVWSDVLELSVGNPLLIEVKATVSGRGAQEAVQAFSALVAHRGSRWGLLLYGEGPDVDESLIRMAPNVLALKINVFLERLRTRGFPEVVFQLRNRRVHGGTL